MRTGREREKRGFLHTAHPAGAINQRLFPRSSPNANDNDT